MLELGLLLATGAVITLVETVGATTAGLKD